MFRCMMSTLHGLCLVWYVCFRVVLACCALLVGVPMVVIDVVLCHSALCSGACVDLGGGRLSTVSPSIFAPGGLGVCVIAVCCGNLMCAVCTAGAVWSVRKVAWLVWLVVGGMARSRNLRGVPCSASLCPSYYVVLLWC